MDEFVEALWVFEDPTLKPVKERALPDGCAQLIINLREDQNRIYDPLNFSLREKFNGCLLVGPQTEFCVIDTEGQMAVAGVHFKPGGAYPFFVVPSHELHGAHLPLDALWGRLAIEMRDQLLEAATPDEQLDVMEQVLLTQFRHPGDSHAVVKFALREFQSGPLTKSVAEVADQTGFSPRHFINIFRREVGLTPKLFCRCVDSSTPCEGCAAAS